MGGCELQIKTNAMVSINQQSYPVRHTAFELSSISDPVASSRTSEFSLASLVLLGSEPRCCVVIPGVIFEARRFPEAKGVPGILKL